MDEIPVSLVGWLWWFFTVVVVAILVNLASQYLVPLVDKILSRFFTALRSRNKANQELRELMVSRLMSDRISSIEYKLRSNELLIRMVLYLVALAGLFSLMISLETRTALALIGHLGLEDSAVLTLQNTVVIIGALFLLPVLSLGLYQMGQYLRIRNVIKTYDHRRNTDNIPWS